MSLASRSRWIKQVRTFFEDRSVLEVDTPLLNPFPQVDAHIEPISAEGGYLHTSPEYGMKRLLADEPVDIYQICHVFRKGEYGKIHNPEFTMIEWYQVGASFEDHIADNIALISLFVPINSPLYFTYREAFIEWGQLDPFTASDKELETAAANAGFCSTETTRASLLHFLWSCVVEPSFPEGQLIVITSFPHFEAAYAQTEFKDQFEVARRFECYYNGMELANGYHELRDADELLRRAPSIKDEAFIEATSRLPDCCGTALGFDRLLMLALNAPTIHAILPGCFQVEDHLELTR